MRDKNGKGVTIGAKAVVLGVGLDLEGKVGTVRDIKFRERHGKQHPVARVSEGDEGNWDWSTWLREHELTIVE